MNTLAQKAQNAIRDPKRALRIMRFWFYKNTKPIEHLLHKHRDWNTGKEGIRQKEYASYGEYIRHQKSKFKKMEHYLHSKYDTKYREALTKRLREQGVIQAGMNVLCIAARLGTEVKSFIDLGCFAIGLDLNPGKENKYVVTGDFHHIQFADSSVDVVFSNSLDHALDMEKLIFEVKRVLKPGGLFVVEVMEGTEEMTSEQYGYYESSAWATIDDLLRVLNAQGFTVEKQEAIEYPFEGQHIYLRFDAASS